MGNAFGTLLRCLRKQAGFSLAGLAGLLDLPPSRISAIERGLEAPLAAGAIKKAARLMEVEPDPLLAAAQKDLRDEFRRQWSLSARPQKRRPARQRTVT